jgi:choline transport protein
LGLAISSGGSTSVVWGLITAGVCNICLAASLAEFLSAYPTAGGQYHWVAMISPKRWVPLLSWITGWINTAGWIALVASAGLLGSTLIIGLLALFNPDYVPQPWHQFLIYIAYNLVAFLINAFGNHILPHFNRAAFIWSISGFAIISVTVLATASPSRGGQGYNSASFVFTEFLNTTGWPDGIAWLLGLLQGGFGLVGYDAVAHMIEEIPNASIEGPKIMLYCVGIGVFTGFIFLVILLFVAGNIDIVISSASGPLIQTIFNATQSNAATAALLCFPLVCLLFAALSIMTTSSRMTYAFARDGALPFSRVFARVHPKLGIPLNSLYLTTACVILFGCIFLGSSSAFNAIISASVVALNVSYGIPVIINCLQGRRMLGPRKFALPEAIGWIANIVCASFSPNDCTTNQFLDWYHICHNHHGSFPLPASSSGNRPEHELCDCRFCDRSHHLRYSMVR